MTVRASNLENESETISYLSVITPANVVTDISYDNDFAIRTCRITPNSVFSVANNVVTPRFR